MYGVLREFQAPLGVTHAVRGRFGTGNNAWATIFARKNSLDHYVVRANAQMARLELLQTTHLGANIISLAVLRRSAAAGDLLCIGFDRMHIAVMAWDRNIRNWTTEQLLDLGSLLGTKFCSPSTLTRALDPDDYGRALIRGTVGEDSEPLIRSDPSGRCIGVLAKKQNIIYIVPVHSDEESSAPGARVVNRGDVFLIDLQSEYAAANIKDFEFLQGSFEPNIIILHEPKRTWSGRAAIQKNTCFLLNISVDIRQKRHSKTWAMDQLPHHCESLEAVPETAGGGALVLAAGIIMQVRHGAFVAGLSLNCYGDAYTSEVKGKYDTITASDTLVECDAAHCRFLDVEENTDDSSAGSVQCIALLSLKGGELYFLNVAVGSRKAITMKRAGSTVIASEIVPINDRFFVLASRLSDSLLVEYQRVAEDPSKGKAKQRTSPKVANTEANADAPTKSNRRKKRRRTAEEEAEYEMIYGVKPPQESSDEDTDDEGTTKPSALELEEKDEGTRGVYDDDDELGWVFNSGGENDSSKAARTGTGSWALKVKDTLTCFGPGADLAIGPSPEDPTRSKLDMVIAGGYAKNGCLAVVHQSIRPTANTEFSLPSCRGVWTLIDPAVVRQEKMDRENRNAAASRRNAGRRARNTKKQAARKRYLENGIRNLQSMQKEKENLRKAQATANTSADTPEVANGIHPLGEDVTNSSKSVENGTLTDADNDHNIRTDEEPSTNTPPSKKFKSDTDSPDDETERPETSDIEIEQKISMLEAEAEAQFPLEPEEEMEEGIADEGSLHAYMLLSTSDETFVLRAGTDLEKVPDGSVKFISHERTVAAGNVFRNQGIVQVVPSGVRVLMDGKIQCEYKVEGGNRIETAQVSDPLILLQAENGQCTVLNVTAELCKDEEVNAPENPATSSQVMEDVFDEYGMPLPGNKTSSVPADGITKEGNSSTMTQNGAESGHVEQKIRYQNFSLAVMFKSSEVPGSEDLISSSFLYKGPLSVEISNDGILANDEKQSDTIEVAGTVKEEETTREDPSNTDGLELKEGQQSPVEGTQIDDEDRMLYGDDQENEEDMMLYGSGDTDDGNANEETTAMNGKTGKESDATLDATHPKKTESHIVERITPSSTVPEKGVLSLPNPSTASIEHGHLLILCKASGSLHIRSPSLKYALVLECPTFFAAPAIVKDSPLSEDDQQNIHRPLASADLRCPNIAMMELSGSALLPGLSTPILIAMSSTGIPMVYRAFMSPKMGGSHARSRLTLHRITARDRTAHLTARLINCVQNQRTTNSEQGTTGSEHIPFSHFENIAGRAGLFAGGPCPFFLFAERVYPRIHALSHANTTGKPTSREEYDRGQGVLAFSEFHNVKCPRGFVSVGEDGTVRIGQLPPPSAMNFDAPTPMKKISLRCTPHKVAYHAGSATYGVLASMPTLTTREERLARILQSLEKHDKRHYQHTAAQAEAEAGDDRANRVPPLFEELHELRVYRPDTWELIKSHKLQKGEVGLAIANMKVDVYKQKTAASGADIPSSKKGDDGNESAFAASMKMRPKDMLVIGTGHLNGEDASSRGRLLFFEISRQEVYTEAGGVYTAFQLQLIAEKELFSPVTAVASMEGYVIAGVGPQVSVYKLVGDEIVHLSFAFGQLYCTSLASIKQYVVAADMCKSVSFMYFRERNNSVNFLGKDYEHVTSYATEFLLENENMSIIVSDGRGNVQLMNYAHASVPESRGGKRLLINGGTQFGSRINKFVRTRTPDLENEVEKYGPNSAGSHALMFTTLDGGIGALVAVNESDFKKMESLRSKLVTHPGVIRHAGVNPEEETAFRPEAGSTVLLDQRMLDSRTIYDLFSVTLVEMSMVARDVDKGLSSLAKTLLNLDSVISRF